MTIAESDGFRAVTMRRVAAALGTGAASLYRYVADRGELLELELRRARLARRSRRERDGGGPVAAPPPVVHRHPLPTGPNVLRLSEHLLAVLAEHPAPSYHKMEALGILDGLIPIWARFLDGSATAQLMTAQVSYLVAAATDGKHPHLAAALAEPPPGPPEEPPAMFRRVLGMLIDGLLGPSAGG